MSSLAALFSAPLAHSLPSLPHAKPQLPHKPYHLSLKTKKSHNLLLISTWATTDNGSSTPAATVEAAIKADETPVPEVKEDSSDSNGSVPPLPPPPEEAVAAEAVAVEAVAVEAVAAEAVQVETVVKFENPKWINGTWDLTQFQKDGKPNWDAVIDAEARRRKWLQDNPESSNNEDPVVFDTSIVPWWAWIKRFHLPEAELLNGRAAMVGFFMAYFVDSLTGVGLVDQMGNFFCKTLLFVAVAGVLLIRKNEDIDNLKQLLDETTFYDKQWQATWQEDTSSSSKKE